MSAALVQGPIDAESGATSELPTLELAQLERLAIAEALRQVNGNRTHAARLLGIGLRTLRNKLNGPQRIQLMEVQP